MRTRAIRHGCAVARREVLGSDICELHVIERLTKMRTDSILSWRGCSKCLRDLFSTFVH